MTTEQGGGNTQPPKSFCPRALLRPTTGPSHATGRVIRPSARVGLRSKLWSSAAVAQRSWAICRDWGRGNIPYVKNGPSLGVYGAVAINAALTASVTRLPGQLRKSLTWDRARSIPGMRSPS